MVVTMENYNYNLVTMETNELIPGYYGKLEYGLIMYGLILGYYELLLGYNGEVWANTVYVSMYGDIYMG